MTRPNWKRAARLWRNRAKIAQGEVKLALEQKLALEKRVAELVAQLGALVGK